MSAVAPRCPCGAQPVVDTTPALPSSYRWRCACPSCYDPTPRSDEQPASARSVCEGFGETAEQAISDWWVEVESTWCIDYLPNTLIAELSEQAGDEADRQRGWVIARARTESERAISQHQTIWYGPREVSP